MPARDLHFTFNTKIEPTKKNIEELKNNLEEYLYTEDLENLLKEFNRKEVDKEFFTELVKKLKSFDSVSDDDCFGIEKAILDFLRDIVADEIKEPIGILGIKYLYDEWEYEGCGSNDHYYYTFTDEKKVIKKYIKEAKQAVDKLVSMGVKVTFTIEEEE